MMITLDTEVQRVNTHADPRSTSTVDPSMNSCGITKAHLSSEPGPGPGHGRNLFFTSNSNVTACSITNSSPISSTCFGPRYNCIPDWARDMRYSAMRLGYIRGDG